MKKLKKLAFLTGLIFFIYSLCLLTVNAQNSFITLDNAAASISGTGYADMKPAPTAYDSTSGYIINTGTGSKVIYTAGKNINGLFDIYLEVSRAVMGFGTTPFSISINGKKETVPIIEYGFSKKTDKSDIYDKGAFLCLKNTEIKAGDRLTVTALPGFVFGTSSFLPCIGDIRLYKPDTKVSEGYDGIIRPDLPIKKEDPLSGLKLIWVGSSVTYGQAAQGYSMADYLEETHQTLKSYKYAISGTTLVDDAPTSYISRIKHIPADMHPDFFIVQLSTNDAAAGKPFGSLSRSRDLKDFDTGTIYGAMEYIVAYASKTWNCPVFFYTGTFYDGSTYSNDGTAYKKMVDALYEVKKKWGIDVIDLYNDKAMKDIYNTDKYKEYMSDGVHPKVYGYRAWWGPEFEKALTFFIRDRQ